MSKTKDYIIEQTQLLNTKVTLEDKIGYLITQYENPLIDIEAVTKLLALIVEDLENKK